MPNCNTNELAKLFDLCALIYRQIDMDSIEVKQGSKLRNMISDNRGKKVDQNDGDFGNLINDISEFDRQVLEASLKWIREQLGWSESDLKIVYNPKTKTAFIAAKDLAKLNEFVANHHDNSYKISIHSQLNKAAFYVTDTFEKSNLSPKGLAVLQDYYAKKDGVRNDTFIGDSLELYKAFDALADAKDGTAINILFRCGSHWIPLRCEKQNGQYFFMEMDSLGTLNDAKINGKTDVISTYICRALAQSKLKSQGSKVHILRARNLRQVGPNNCAFFSLKDARKMQRDPNLFSEISAHVINATKQTTEEGYSYAEYLTPIEYVGTTQQPKTIRFYVDKYNELKPGGKSVTHQDVWARSLGRKRDNPEKSRVKLTGTEADQAYLEFVDTKERANLTIPYFKDKYMSNVVDKKVKNASLDELSSIVDRYNINKITPSRLNEIADHPVNVNKISDDKENIIEISVKVQDEPQAKEILQQLEHNIPLPPQEESKIESKISNKVQAKIEKNASINTKVEKIPALKETPIKLTQEQKVIIDAYFKAMLEAFQNPANMTKYTKAHRDIQNILSQQVDQLDAIRTFDSLVRKHDRKHDKKTEKVQKIEKKLNEIKPQSEEGYFYFASSTYAGAIKEILGSKREQKQPEIISAQEQQKTEIIPEIIEETETITLTLPPRRKPLIVPQEPKQPRVTSESKTVKREEIQLTMPSLKIDEPIERVVSRRRMPVEPKVTDPVVVSKPTKSTSVSELPQSQSLDMNDIWKQLKDLVDTTKLANNEKQFNKGAHSKLKDFVRDNNNLNPKDRNKTLEQQQRGRLVELKKLAANLKNVSNPQLMDIITTINQAALPPEKERRIMPKK